MDISSLPEVVLATALQRFSKKEIGWMLDVDSRTVVRWSDGAAMQEAYRLALLYLLTHREPLTSRPSFTFIDLFAGIGGMRIGFEAAGGQCIFTSEYDPGCQ